jgi:hypothetical protein
MAKVKRQSTARWRERKHEPTNSTTEAPSGGRIQFIEPGAVQCRAESGTWLKEHARITLGDEEHTPRKLTKRVSFIVDLLNDLAKRGIAVDAMSREPLLDLVQEEASKKTNKKSALTVGMRNLRHALAVRRQRRK